MIVIDATVAVKLVTLEPGADIALARVAREADRLAPDWIRAELANTLAKKVRNDGLSPDAALAAMSHIDDFFTETFEALDLLDDAFQLAVRLEHAVYDCVYLALAIRQEAVVLTHDMKFARSVERAGLGDRIELLG